jgi:16S rRNA (adenine1518-N6/adenine1519-N6)-dimethyltransferase
LILLFKKTDLDKKLISLINDIFSYRRKTVKNILKQFNQQSTIEKRIDDLTGEEIVNLAKQILKK